MKASPLVKDPLKYCVTKFSDYKCGYETTCSKNSDAGTCKCGDGTMCVWSGNNKVNCPCDVSSYLGTTTYVMSNLAPCQQAYINNKCNMGTGAQLTCATTTGVGSCKCADTTTCAFGPDYGINCPCGQNPF